MFSTCLCVPGRIKAAQLEYSEAHKHLVQAMRKAPQQSAVGFRQTVSLAYCHKLLFTGPGESSTERAIGFRQMVSLACCHKHLFTGHEKSSTAADSESFSAGSRIITGICQIMQVTQMTDDTAVLNGTRFIWSLSVLRRSWVLKAPCQGFEGHWKSGIIISRDPCVKVKTETKAVIDRDPCVKVKTETKAVIDWFFFI